MREAKVVFVNRRSEQEYQEVFWKHVPPGFNVLWVDADQSSDDEIIRQVSDADFLFLRRSGVPEQALRQAKKLKLIQVLSQGYDRVPLPVTSALGIPVANIGGANAISVAEFTVLLILASLRRIFPSVAALKQGKFVMDLDRRLYHQLYGKTVGLVGFGNIGQRVTGLIYHFNANIIFYDTAEVPQAVVKEVKARRVELEELLRTADIVSLHVPLLETTRGMLGWEQLKLMKPSAILVNTSRGEVVDEKALIRALRQKKIAGAGLDVYSKEPPDRGNPLLTMQNVVATPHIAGAVWENLDTRFEMVWSNVIGVWRGEPPRNVVTT
ncbi:NAD(P)-dependent oxidoreductase [Chloroflexota bacterium]